MGRLARSGKGPLNTNHQQSTAPLTLDILCSCFEEVVKSVGGHQCGGEELSACMQAKHVACMWEGYGDPSTLKRPAVLF